MKVSLPLRECGLKFNASITGEEYETVTPLAGVWVEMPPQNSKQREIYVTPLAGVWVEINKKF